jgi:hypothetical protein
MTSPTPGAPAIRRTAREREMRRVRIMGMVRSGFSYEAIAGAEGLSRERIRQIVVKSLKDDEGGAREDHTLVQIARLEPALRLAARGVEDGRLEAIQPLLKVLAQLDKYCAVAEASQPYDDNPHERLMAKINGAAARLGIGIKPPEAEDGAEILEDDESGLEGV